MYPVCLGRMTELFELNIGASTNKLLTDKSPHQGGTHLMRSKSDVTRMRRSVDPIEEKDILSHFNNRLPNRTSNKAPMKKFISQEMSMEFDSRRDPPNLVARLMGIDALSQRKLGSTTQRSHSRFPPQNGYVHYIDPNDYKDDGVKWQQSHKYEDNINDMKMNFVRRKFVEAKCLSIDEKLRNSKQYQDALDVLSSNGDLFLKCLQEPTTPMLSQHLHGPPMTRRITILKPSKVENSSGFPVSRYRDEKQIKNGTVLQQNHSENKIYLANSAPPMRIVVLKPGPVKLLHAEAVALLHSQQQQSHSVPSNLGSPLQSHLPKMLFSGDFLRDAEDGECQESRKVAKSITRQIRERLEDRHPLGENLVSSLFPSNGYAGNESSFDNTSDLEAMSPASGNVSERLGSPCPSPVFTRASYSPESSVCREARKRLSERWAMIAANRSCPEQRQFERGSSTLGEMIARLDKKKGDPQAQREGESCFDLFVGERKREESVDCSPRNLLRSKSVPVSSTVFDIPDSGKRKPVSPRGDAKETRVVSTFRWTVSSLFLSRNRKGGKNKSPVLGTKDEEAPSFTGEIFSDKTGSPSVEGWDGDSSEPSRAGKQGIISPKAGLAVAEPIASTNIGAKYYQSSPIYPFDPPLEESELTPKPSDYQGVERPINCIGPSLIDKSPPIGSIARTLPVDGSCVNISVSSQSEPFTAHTKIIDEQAYLTLVRTLLSAAALEGIAQPGSFFARWHSLESPLDPCLRDNYINDSNYALQEAEKRHHASIQTLVFDWVNEVLRDIACGELDPRRKYVGGDGCITDMVWGRMKVRLGGAGYSDVVGEGVFGWEVDGIGEEIGVVVLEELVEEAVVVFTGRDSFGFGLSDFKL